MKSNHLLPSALKDGVRFECQGSGKCCVSHGEYGHVYLSRKDSLRMAKNLNLKLAEFRKKYCQQLDGFWAIRDNGTKLNCLFLIDKKCSIYQARPTQCRTWPFWPEVMTAKKWKKDVVNFCPGIGKGPLIKAKEIVKISEIEIANTKQMKIDATIMTHFSIK